MKRKIKFCETMPSVQVCFINKGTLSGVGASEWDEADNCKPSVLTGQTIAYYKAERDLCKQERKILKQEISHIEKLGVFIFPKKLACKETGFVKDRFDKYLSQKKQKLRALDDKINYWDKALEKYIEDKKKVRAKIESKFARVDDGRKLESKEA